MTQKELRQIVLSSIDPNISPLAMEILESMTEYVMTEFPNASGQEIHEAITAAYRMGEKALEVADMELN